METRALIRTCLANKTDFSDFNHFQTSKEPKEGHNYKTMKQTRTTITRSPVTPSHFKRCVPPLVPQICTCHVKLPIYENWKLQSQKTFKHDVHVHLAAIPDRLLMVSPKEIS